MKLRLLAGMKLIYLIRYSRVFLNKINLKKMMMQSKKVNTNLNVMNDIHFQFFLWGNYLNEW